MYHVLVKTNEVLTNWYPGPHDLSASHLPPYKHMGYMPQVVPTYHIYRQNVEAPLNAVTYEPEDLIVVVKTIVTGRASGYVDISVFANSFELLRNLWNITGVDLFHLLESYSCYNQAMPMMVLEGTPLYQPTDITSEEQVEKQESSIEGKEQRDLIDSLRNVDLYIDDKLVANLKAACREAFVGQFEATVRRCVVSEDVLETMIPPSDTGNRPRSLGYLIPYRGSDAVLFVVTTESNLDCQNVRIRLYNHLNSGSDILEVVNSATSVLTSDSPHLKYLREIVMDTYRESNGRFIWGGIDGLFTSHTSNIGTSLWEKVEPIFTLIVDQTSVNSIADAKTGITDDDWAIIDYTYLLNKKGRWKNPVKLGPLGDIVEVSKFQ